MVRRCLCVPVGVSLCTAIACMLMARFCAGVKGLASRSSGKYLASSKSSPNLLVPSADTVCVLGKECRSRRRLATADQDASGPPASLAELKGAHSHASAQAEGCRQEQRSPMAVLRGTPTCFRQAVLRGGTAEWAVRRIRHSRRPLYCSCLCAVP